MLTRFRVTFLALGFCLCAAANAGDNVDFTTQLGVPERIENPTVGQRISIPVFFQQMTVMKGGTVSFRYDPEVVAFVGFTAGSITPGAFGLPGKPLIGDDGFAVIEAGTTLLGKGVTVTTSGGLFGTFEFELIAELPDAGSPISVVRVEVNTSADPEDRDVLDLRASPLRVLLVPVFRNAIFNVVVERKHNGAALSWNTRLTGLDDIVRLRPAGSESEFVVFTNPVADRFAEQVIVALRTLRQRNINFPAMADQVVADALRELLDLPNATTEQLFNLVRRVRELDNLLQSRRHVVLIPDLPGQTQFEFELVSRSLDGRRSPVHRGRFSTRLAPDLRPLFVSQFDVQVTRTGAAVSFGTNRPASATYILRRLPDGDIVTQDTLNENGEARTRIALEDLEPGVEYEIEVTASLIDADELIAEGLPADAAFRTIRKRFRTHLQTRRLRMLRPPVKIVGSERANIVFEVNQPVDAIVDYGLVTVGGSGKITQEVSTDSEDLYTWQQESVASLNLHNLTLSNLDPGTLFRYKITLVNAEGDTFTTDPTGNFQFSRDLKFKTAAAADTLPPEVIQGPIVDIRDVLAVVRFVTDVPTAATIFIGTDGGTYNTEDEFEFPDLTPDGERRFANRHSVIVSGLDAGSSYRYRLEIESTSGKTTTFEPSLGSGKRAGVQQPPGGAGSFTTSNDPDTQFPVILSGPTVSSKSHETAIIEWTTDEPADSELNFGLDSVSEDSESSAIATTSHKVILSNLESGGTYTYIVGSTDASGNGATQSSEAVFTTDPDVDLTAPEITGDPEIIYKNDESATIQWTTDEDASGEVTFGTESDNLGFIRTLPETDKTHEVTLTNLEVSTTYFYQVSSEDLSNNGPTLSQIASFTTDASPDLTLPTISNIAVAESDSSVILTWETDELADSFVDFGTVSGILDLTVGGVEDVTKHEITLTNLTPGQTYFYTVGSIDRANNGPTESAEGSFATLSSADVTPPATPADLSGTAGSEQVLLSWTANTELDLGGYNIYRRTAADAEFSAIATRVTDTFYTDAGLANDVEYEYQITAIDRETLPNESATTELSLTPTLSAAPTTPADLSVGGPALLPTFTFSNAEPFTSGATLTYTIQVSTQSDFSDVTDSESGVTEASGATSWTITRSLTDGQTYFWRVRAVEGSLPGPFTAAQEFTVSDAPLLAGDFNDSGAVDFDDFFAFVDAFGQSADDFPDFDLNGSGSGTFIDFDDFFAFVDAFGTTAGKAGSAWAFAHRLDETARLRLVATGGPMAIEGTGLPRDVVRLRIFVDDVETLSAYGLVLKYDPAALSFSEARQGPGSLLESQGGDAGLFRVLDERPGRLLIGSGLVDGAPVSGSGLLAELTFRLRDRRLATDTRFDLQQVFLAGGVDDVRRAVAVEPTRLRPTAFALGQAYPNPFNPSTHIDFALAAESPARLVVYDVLGRTVRTLVRADEALPAGFYSVTWDGRDASGRPVGNGLYFYRLTTAVFSRTGKMMMLK
jgi:phosphodiesterase/alkaline phosphatase D-like protein